MLFQSRCDGREYRVIIICLNFTHFILFVAFIISLSHTNTTRTALNRQLLYICVVFVIILAPLFIFDFCLLSSCMHTRGLENAKDNDGYIHTEMNKPWVFISVFKHVLKCCSLRCLFIRWHRMWSEEYRRTGRLPLFSFLLLICCEGQFVLRILRANEILRFFLFWIRLTREGGLFSMCGLLSRNYFTQFANTAVIW